MKIRIITMEDPLYTLDFFKEIIKSRHQDITGITIAKGGRLKIGKKNSKIIYLTSLLLIMGPIIFLKNSIKTVFFKIRKKVSVILPLLPSPDLATFAETYSIPVDYTDNPNAEDYLKKLKAEEPDVIINQSQFIIKKTLLSIPKIGVLNRHNALLPKNRGRLTPFWVLFKGEKETGVSIHFVDEGIDSGPIVVQKRFEVNDKDTFNSVVEKNYQLAAKAMLEALDIVETGKADYIENSDENATYNSIPTLREAMAYRKKRVTMSKRK